MNVEDLRTKKLKLETELRDFISDKLNAFTKDTGVSVSSCNIDITQIVNGIGEHYHYTLEVDTWIKL